MTLLRQAKFIFFDDFIIHNKINVNVCSYKLKLWHFLQSPLSMKTGS